MLSHNKISVFAFQLLETHVKHKWKIEVKPFILHKRNLDKKPLFGKFDQMQKCS